jgi:simple sugar transport system permease protein
MDWIFLVGLLASGVRFATPVLYAALGETVTQRAGVLNVGIEGIMLIGAFMAALGAVASGTPWGGLALALGAGALFGALHGFFCVILKVDQIVSGIGLIVLGLGLSGFGYRVSLGAASGPLAVPSFERLDFGPLRAVPGLGAILFDHHLLVYLGVALALALAWALRRTGLGLSIRAVGENPAAADAAGLPVNRLRFLCTVFGGALAAVGGAYLSIAQLGGFVENMIAGRGFIAIACVVFGRWHPLGVLLAVLFFGLAEALQIRLQTLNPDIPYQFFVMMPYALAILALILFAGRAGAPAALRVPFVTGRRPTAAEPKPEEDPT